MNTCKIPFHQLLPEYRIKATQSDTSGHRLQIETLAPPTHCTYCASSNIVGFGRRNKRVHDCPAEGAPVILNISTRRLRCGSCSRTFSEALPLVDERRAMTSRLIEWVAAESMHRPFVHVARDIGVTEGTVRSVVADYAANHR
jgi:transposase